MNLTHRIAPAFMLVTFLAVPSTQAEVTVPAIVGDGMVLQRESDAPIWGWAAAEEAVTVQGSWSEHPVRVVADPRGRWTARIPTPAAGGPYTLTITGATNTIKCDDVLVGEVWLCSGQSNMEWPLTKTRNAADEIAAADHPRIRLFTVPNKTSAMPRVDSGGAWAMARSTSSA